MRKRRIALPPPSVLFDDDVAGSPFAARFSDNDGFDANPETSTSPHSPGREVTTVMSSRGRVLVLPPNSELPLPPGVRRPPSPIAEGSLRLDPIEVATADGGAGVFTERSRTLRSMLKNFLTNEYGTLNPMVNLAQHQIDSGVPVTDATVQEVTRFHPTMTGIDLRECRAITDVGLWALAKRSATRLHDLNVSGVEQITHIGLRALSLRCDRLQRLDLTRCVQLNDLGLRVVAAGLIQLTHLRLRGCRQVTDHSLVEVARCCEKLRLLDLHGCDRCCEYGDGTLVELAKHAPKLHTLDLTGCKFVRANGLRTLAQSCPLVHTLQLGQTAAGRTPARKGREHVICAIARGMPALTILDLSGFSAPTNRDWKTIGKHLPELQILLLTGCSKIRSSALSKIGNGCLHLRELDLTGCAHIGLEAAGALAASEICTSGETGRGLTSLDLRKCPKIDATSLALIASKMSRLTTLKVTPSARNGGTTAVRAIASELPFVLPAEEDVAARKAAEVHHHGASPDARADASDSDSDSMDLEMDLDQQLEELAAELAGANNGPRWVGWSPKSDAVALIATEERRRIEDKCAFQIQHLYARFVARKYMVELATKAKQLWVLPRFQALWWGYKVRQRVAKIRHDKLAALSAVVITSLWWGYLVRIEAAKRRRLIAMHSNTNLAAIVLQKKYRGKMGRRIVARMRRKIARALARQSLKLTLRDAAAVTIQHVWDVYKGKSLAALAMRAKELLALAESELLAAARLVQKAWRCRGARQVFAMRKAAVAAMRQDGAVRLVQRRYRGLLARRQYLEKKKARDYEIFRNGEATKIQNRWRVHRSGYVKSMLGRMRAARKHEDVAASLIQRAYRGYLGRGIFKAARWAKQQMAVTNSAAAVIQNCFRGFKAREASEVMRALAIVAQETRPITDMIEGLEASKLGLQEELTAANTSLAIFTEEIEQLGRELREVSMVKTDFYDSARITGAPQRYRTSFLVRTLRDQIDEIKSAMGELPATIGELNAKIRTKDREIRASKRELRPIQERARQQTRAARRARLKESIKTSHTGAVGMQKLWRGYTVRSVLGEVDLNELMCWIEAWDEERGQPYYYNTFSEETKWGIPGELTMLGIVPAQVDTSDPWMECWDESSSSYYYFNTTTQEYRWEDPRIADQFAPAGAGYGDGAQWWDDTVVAGGEQEVALLSARSNRTGAAVHEWEELQDGETGYTYYQHRETGEVTWSLPPQVAARGTGARIGNFVDSPNSRANGEGGFASGGEGGDGASVYSRGGLTTASTAGGLVHHHGGARAYEDGAPTDAELARLARRDAAYEEKRRIDSAWVESVDGTTGERYHFNTITEEASWDGPKLLLPATAEGSFRGDGEPSFASTTQRPADWDNGAAYGDSDNGYDAEGGAEDDDGDWRGGGDNADAVDDTEEEDDDDAERGGEDGAANAPIDDLEATGATGDGGGDGAHHEWEACVTEDGTPYWYDAISGESTWSEPVDFIDTVAPPAAYGGPAEVAMGVALGATPALPLGWEAVDDPEGGGTYYYNSVDGTTTWDVPLTAAAGADGGAYAAVEGGAYEYGAQETSVRPTTVRSELAFAAEEEEEAHAASYGGGSASEWELIDDGAGSQYYYNAATGETQWEAPPGFAATQGGDAAAWGAETSPYEEYAEGDDAPLPAGWEAIDDGAGSQYYYNAGTGESVWERPTY